MWSCSRGMLMLGLCTFLRVVPGSPPSQSLGSSVINRYTVPPLSIESVSSWHSPVSSARCAQWTRRRDSSRYDRNCRTLLTPKRCEL